MRLSARPPRRAHYVMFRRHTVRVFAVTREEVRAARQAGGNPDVLQCELAAGYALAWLWRLTAEHWARV